MGAPSAVTVFAVLCGLSCASSRETDVELSRLRAEVDELKQDIANTKTKLRDMEERAASPASGRRGDDAGRPHPSDTKRLARTSRPNLPIVRVEPARDLAPSAIEASEEHHGAVDDGGPPILIKLGPDSDAPDRLHVDRSILRRPDPVLSNDGPRETYERAVAILTDSGDAISARKRLLAFVAEHPNSSLKVFASYWAAECAFRSQNYRVAVDEFVNLVRDNPSFSKTPEVLLRMGMARRKLGEIEQARLVWNEVVRTYPNTESAKKASDALLELGDNKPISNGVGG